MEIVVEAGGTKCKWGIIDNGAHTIETIGFNPNCGQAEGLLGIAKAVAETAGTHAESVLYYGAGCGNKQNQEKVTEILKLVFSGANIKVCSDLEGAAYALFGNNSGIAAILGTGAAAGIYNGSEITKQAPSLGYLLGDEGSGAFLGKTLIQKVLRNELSADLCAGFWRFANTTSADLIRSIYSSSATNSYLASFATFLSQNISNEQISAIVTDGFDIFYNKHIKPLNANNLPIGFVGGIAFQFCKLLKGYFENKGHNIKVLKDAYEVLMEKNPSNSI